MKFILDEAKSHIERITNELIKNIGSDLSFIREIGEHILLGNGKLLRPLLFVLSCKLLGYEEERIYSLSTVFEYIHVASLLHDDVLDNAEMRRNRPSVNTVWGDHAAILQGDFLYARSLIIALSTKNLRFLEKIADATNRMVEGQIMELICSNNVDLTREQYFSIIEKKTSSLLSAACECAAVLAGTDIEKEIALHNFGHNLGMAFQLIDDMLDYISSEDVFGKPVGKDLREGKVTLPLIYAIQEIGEEDRGRIIKLLKEKGNNKEYEYILKKVTQTKAISRTKYDALNFVNKAKRSLDLFDSSPIKDILIELSNYVVQRER